MTEQVRPPHRLAAWKALREHRRELGKIRITDLYRKDPGRVSRLVIESDDLLLDYSRNIVTRRTMQLLTRLAKEAAVESFRDRMFAGEHINVTEDRAVLHAALRAGRRDRFREADQDCTRDVHDVLDAMGAFVDGVRDGRLRGFGSRRPFTDVVNIGIGGSDLGIVMALSALGHYQRPDLRVHCVSNIDGTQLADVLGTVDPRTTLFVVCSKTFTTQETLTNARAARAWLVERLGDGAVERNFAAVSTNHAAMDAFGINPDYRFGFWDWVGGRYSIWSAVGLSVALGVGMEHFRAFLAGGRDMDRHFRTAPLGSNMPVVLALLAIWYNDFFGAETQAVLPYDGRLHRFPAFLQQMHMESNGKSVLRDGRRIQVPTGTVIWGEAGNNAQHSFYQLLHQGTRLIPVDFLAPAQGSSGYREQHLLALANMLAQAEALAHGRDAQQVAADLESQGLAAAAVRRLTPHKVHPGNRPCNIVLFRRLDPRTLGRLVALYEHKVLVEGAVWGIDSFDQWGVELGKKLAGGMHAALTEGPDTAGVAAGPAMLIKAIRRWRG